VCRHRLAFSWLAGGQVLKETCFVVGVVVVVVVVGVGVVVFGVVMCCCYCNCW